MESFGALIDESFKQAAIRARDIGTFLSDASQATAGLIEQQFGEIRTNTGKERERTASALRTAYEQANGELETIMRQTTERFQTAASEMRGMAYTIREELDATCEEVRRSVTELPRETAEQAAAMRRIVFEQVKALNELTEIVTRSGRTHDVAEPPQSIVSGPVQMQDSNMGMYRRQQEVPPAPAPVAESILPRRELPPQRVAPPPAATRPIAPTADPRGGGWLSDLLARASRDEPAPQPARTPLERVPAERAPLEESRPALSRGPARTLPSANEQLETISIDISRMIHPEAAAEAWDRYRRGESDAFAQHLYTLRGQQTFDEIRRRYRGDLEFHKTVDRYVKEFERLLADVNRDDRDDTVTRSYLASETGKVYTMLAHASGRLG
jgi:hypothetical protein